MTCREVADFLLEYATGELAPDIRDVFESHLARCANCREYMALYLATMTLGRHAFDDELTAADAGMPEELVMAILASRPVQPDADHS